MLNLVSILQILVLHAAFESSQNFDDVFLLFNISSDWTHVSANISTIL